MPALGTTQQSTFSFRDRTGETGTHTVSATPLTAANFDAQNTAEGEYYDALNQIALGVLTKEQLSIVIINSNALPASNAAQRENKLLVRYRDNVTEQEYTTTIPTIDTSLLTFLPGGGDAVAFTLSNGAGSAITNFVTAFQDYVKAPDTGNAVTITGMRFVGRNT